MRAYAFDILSTSFKINIHARNKQHFRQGSVACRSPRWSQKNTRTPRHVRKREKNEVFFARRDENETVIAIRIEMSTLVNRLNSFEAGLASEEPMIRIAGLCFLSFFNRECNT